MEWHPFPEIKPTSYGNYITTLEYPNGKRYVEKLNWNGTNFTQTDEWGMSSYYEKFVTAWMPLPDAYIKRANP